jgi:hypothetical protein
MAGITGLGTTFNLPNYVGPLFGLTPEDTPFLSAIGGLTGGQQTDDTRFGWQTYDLRDPGQNTRVEGADAPTAEQRVRNPGYNVVQIHQEAVEVSYTKQAAVGRMSTVSSNVIGGAQPVRDELAWQTEQRLKEMARDINYSFIRGTFADPANNATARKTRGILEHIATNVVDAGAGNAAVTLATSAAADDIIDTASAHGFVAGDSVRFPTLTGGTGLVANQQYYVVATSLGAQTFRVAATPGGAPIDFSADITAGTVRKDTAISKATFLNLAQLAWSNGGLQEGQTRTVIVNAWQKRALTEAFLGANSGLQITSRNVGGVNLQTIETDFGTFNIMLDRMMPIDQMAVVSLEQISPVFLLIPGKGFLFREPLAKTGASNREQLYGEVGLNGGNELAHAKMIGLHVGF